MVHILSFINYMYWKTLHDKVSGNGQKFTTMVYEINKSRDLKERTGNHIWKKVFESTLMTENILIYAHHISYKNIRNFCISLNSIIIQNWMKKMLVSAKQSVEK